MILLKYTPCVKKLCIFICQNSELRQIPTNFNKFWQADVKVAELYGV